MKTVSPMTLLQLIALLFLLVHSLLPAHASASSPLDESATAQMDRARKTHATGDYRASARAFKDVAARAAASGDDLLAARATANIGAAMQGLEDYAGAVQMFGQAVTTMERLGNRQLETAIRINLAVALEKAGQAEEAEAELRRCVAGATDKRAARMLAGSLIRQRRYHEALEVLPNDAVLHNDVGAKLDQSGRTQEALAAFERAVAIDPTLLSAQYNAGLMLVQLQRECGAIVFLEAAHALDPNHAHAFEELVWARQWCGIWRYRDVDETKLRLDLERQLQAVAQGHREPRDQDPAKWRRIRRSLTVQPFHAAAYDFVQDWELELISVAHAQAAKSLVSQEQAAAVASERRAVTAAAASPPVNHPSDDGIIRIGYVSSDFREHAVGLMVQSMFELHDRKSFFVVGYSLQPAQASSSRRKRIEAGLDIHRDLSPIVNDPMKMAMIIARDQIDILVDLNGHSAGNRFELFALRPAKIAVTHAATFSVPAGAPEIFDYTIVDPVVVDHNEYNSDRKSIKGAYLVLPETLYVTSHAQIYPTFTCETKRHGQGTATAVRDARVSAATFVFATYSQVYKINPEIWQTWMNLLRRVRGSVLVLIVPRASRRDSRLVPRIMLEATSRGVDSRRLVFLPAAEHLQHLRRSCDVDLLLDTVSSYNGIMSSVDGLFAGARVLTGAWGSKMTSRVAASLVRATHDGGKVARSLKGYEHSGLEFARDGMKSKGRRLAGVQVGGSLFDTARYVRHLEWGFRSIFDRHRRGLSAADLNVSILSKASN